MSRPDLKPTAKHSCAVIIAILPFQTKCSKQTTHVVWTAKTAAETAKDDSSTVIRKMCKLFMQSSVFLCTQYAVDGEHD